MGVVISCISSICSTIGGVLMAIISGIGSIIQAIISGIVSFFSIIISCLTCGRAGRRKTRSSVV